MKNNSTPQNLRLKTIILFLIIIVQTLAIQAQTNVQGNVSGTWTVANSPYNVIGGLIVSADSTLTIEPGVSVEFQGYYQMAVYGKLLATGTIQDTIVFTVADTTGYSQGTHTGWLGILLSSSSSDTSKIVYCILEYEKKTGIYFGSVIRSDGNTNLLIDHCNMRYNNNDNGTVIFCYSSNPIISNNTISNNNTNGIDCKYSSSFP